jgi:hypothetical protein
MKKLILIALAFVSLQAVAQDKEKSQRKAKGELMKNMSAEDMATIATKKLTLALDLTEKQQVQVKEVMLEQATDRKQKMAQKAEIKKSNEVNGNAKATNVKAINERLDKKIETKQKMKSILTAEQYKKWENMQGRRGKKGKQKLETRRKN